MIDSCIFSNISAFVFLIGLIIYSYFLYLDLKEGEEGIRTHSETIWIWGLYLLLFMGFFISIYCTNNNINDDLKNAFSTLKKKYNGFENNSNGFENNSNGFGNNSNGFGNNKLNFFGKKITQKYGKPTKKMHISIL